MGRKPTPTAGYASRGEAVEAMWNEGLTIPQIATRCGINDVAVKNAVRRLRKQGHDLKERRAGRRAGPLPPGDTRGIWTPDKLDKARRLFGKTMIYIAEALQVPAKELMEYGLKGVIPPMGEGQRVAQLIEHHTEPPAPPSRDDDEAELAALEEEDDDEDEFAEGGDAGAGGDAGIPDGGEPQADGGPAPEEEHGGFDRAGRAAEIPPAPQAAPAAARVVAHHEAGRTADDPGGHGGPRRPGPGAAPGNLYRLARGDGYYLHESLDGLTPNVRYAWKGSTKQLAAVLQRNPQWRELDAERVP